MKPFLLSLASLQVQHLNGSIFDLDLEASGFQFKFSNIFRCLYLFLIRLVDKLAFSFPFNPRYLQIIQLEKSGSVAVTITDNKTLFSVVCLSGTIRLTGKFALKLFPFYPNQCIFSVVPTLCCLLTKPVGLSHLLQYGFD